MKQTFYILMSLMLMVTACSKEDKEEPTDNTPAVFAFEFSFKADGQDQSVTYTQISKNQDPRNLGFASTFPDYYVTLDLDSNMNVGSTYFGFPPTNCALSIKNISTNTWYYASDGDLSITSHDKSAKEITGTFSSMCYDSPAVMQDSVNVTAGKFSFKY